MKTTKEERERLRVLMQYSDGEDYPWQATEYGYVFTPDGDAVAIARDNIAHSATAKERAALIAAAHNALPILLDDLDAAEAEIARLKEFEFMYRSVSK